MRRKVFLSILFILMFAFSIGYTIHTNSQVMRKFEGFVVHYKDNLIIIVAGSELKDVSRDILITIATIRPDTIELIDPINITVRLYFFTIKLAEKVIYPSEYKIGEEKDNIMKISTGMFAVRFDPLFFAGKIKVEVEAYWDWNGEIIKGYTTAYVQTDFFFNISGVFHSAFEKVKSFLSSLFANITSRFSTLIKRLNNVLYKVRMFTKLFSLLSTSYSKAYWKPYFINIQIVNTSNEEDSYVARYTTKFLTESLQVFSETFSYFSIINITTWDSFLKYVNEEGTLFDTNANPIDASEIGGETVIVSSYAYPVYGEPEKFIENLTTLWHKHRAKLLFFAPPFYTVVFPNGTRKTNENYTKLFYDWLGFNLFFSHDFIISERSTSLLLDWTDNNPIFAQYPELKYVNPLYIINTLLNKFFGIQLPSPSEIVYVYKSIGVRFSPLEYITQFVTSPFKFLPLAEYIPNFGNVIYVFQVNSIGITYIQFPILAWNVSAFQQTYDSIVKLFTCYIVAPLRAIGNFILDNLNQAKEFFANITEPIISQIQNALSTFNFTQFVESLSKGLSSAIQNIGADFSSFLSSLSSSMMESFGNIVNSLGEILSDNPISTTIRDIQNDFVKLFQSGFFNSLFRLLTDIGSWMGVSFDAPKWSSGSGRNRALRIQSYVQDSETYYPLYAYSTQYENITKEEAVEKAGAILTVLKHMYSPYSNNTIVSSVNESILILNDYISKLEYYLSYLNRGGATVSASGELHVSGLMDVLGGLANLLSQAGQTVSNTINKGVEWMKNAGSKATDWLSDNINWLKNKVLEWVQPIIDDINAVLSGAIQNVWDYISKNILPPLMKFSQFLSSMLSALNEAFSWLINAIGTVGNAIWSKIQEINRLIQEALNYVQQNLLEQLINVGVEIWNSIKGVFDTVSGYIREAVSWLWDKIKALGDAITSFVNSLPSLVDRGIKFVVGGIFSFSSYVGNVIGNVISYIHSLIGNFSPKIFSAIATLSDLIGRIMSAVKTAFGKLEEVFTRTFDAIKQVIVKGIEAIKNLVNYKLNLSSIRESISRMVRGLQFGGGSIQVITNISNYLGALLYSAEHIGITEEIKKSIGNLLSKFIHLREAITDRQIVPILIKGNTLYFVYIKKSEIVMDASITVEVINEDGTFDVSVTALRKPNTPIYYINLTEIGYKPKIGDIFYLSILSTSGLQEQSFHALGFEDEGKSISVIEVRKYVEVPSFSGKIYVSVPESVKAGDTFPISIELINYKNTTADIKIEAGLKRGKIQLTREEIGYIRAPYKKLVGISSNLTAPAYLFPARYKIVIMILQPDGYYSTAEIGWIDVQASTWTYVIYIGSSLGIIATAVILIWWSRELMKRFKR